MMGLKPWGDSARAAAYAARAEREILERLGGTSDVPASILERVRESIRLPAGSSGAFFDTPARVERAREEYDRAFREWYAGVEKTSGKIAAFHGLVAALGGAAVGASGAYRQGAGVRPVVGASRAFGAAGKYVTGKSPVYDSEGVLSGFAKVGGRPYSRAFNQPGRTPLLKAGSVPAPARSGKMIDPATGRVIGRVRYAPEDAGDGRGAFKGMKFGDRSREVGAMEQYERDMTRAYDAGRSAALRGGFSDIDAGLKAAGFFDGTEVAEAFRDGWASGKEAPPAMDSGAYNAGVAAFREGVALPDAVKEAGLTEGTAAYAAFQKGWLDAPGITDPSEDGGGPLEYDLDATAYSAGLAAYETGLTPADAAREMGIAAGTPAYADLEKGYYDGAGVAEGREVGPYAAGEEVGSGPLPAFLDADPADVAPAGTENPDAYVAGLADKASGRPASPALFGIEPGSVAEGDYMSGYLAAPAGVEDSADREQAEWFDDVQAGHEAEMARTGRDPQGYPLRDPEGAAAYARFLSDLDAAWHAELEAMGGKIEGGNIVREAATDYGAAVSLSQELLKAVKSKTAKDAARALGILSGQWGVNTDVVNKLPPELLGEFEKGLADGRRGYDYGIRPPLDRAAVVRRANAVIAGGVVDPEDPIGGYWPEHLSPKNQDLWAKQAAEGGKGKYGNSAAELLRASMDWLGTAMAENNREEMNAALSYMADTLAAIQEDGRDIVKMRRGDSEDAGDVEADESMPEFDEDGNEVGGESTFYEDSYADPNAVPPWDFERDGLGLFGATMNRALRFVASTENARAAHAARMANRWSDAARAASAAARLAKYGSMMGLKPWGVAARAAAALARGKKGKRAAKPRRTGPGGPVLDGKKKVPAKGDPAPDGGGTAASYDAAVRSYSDNGMEGMAHAERIAIFDEIRGREKKGGKLSEYDKKFLQEFEAFLDREIQRSGEGVDGPVIGFIPLRFGMDAPPEAPDGPAAPREVVPRKVPGGDSRAKILQGKAEAGLYDDYIAGAKAEGDAGLVRQLRAAKNEARKREARERLEAARRDRSGKRPGRNDVYEQMKAKAGIPGAGGFSKDVYGDMKAKAGVSDGKKLVRDNAGKVWDLRKPDGGWEHRGGTPVSESRFYNPSDGMFYDKDGRVVGKAPKAPREGAVFYQGKWFDAKTGKTIPGGAVV